MKQSAVRIVFLLLLMLGSLSSCSPLPTELFEGTSLEICQSSPVGIGKNVKIASAKEKIIDCNFLDKVKVEKCKGIRGDKISYIEKLRNQTRFHNGNVLFIDSSTLMVTEGEAYSCSPEIYEKI